MTQGTVLCYIKIPYSISVFAYCAYWENKQRTASAGSPRPAVEAAGVEKQNEILIKMPAAIHLELMKFLRRERVIHDFK